MDWNEASNEERFQEAERRIEAARQSGAKSLDLGDLGLHELPASLGLLEELEELFLGSRCRNGDGEIYWNPDRPESTITSLASVPALRKLRALYIGPGDALAGDLAPLAQLLNLQSLEISACNALAGDLAPLAQLLNLQSLEIYSCSALAGDLAPLAQLLNLQSLRISFCDALIGDLAPLAQLLNLQTLEILEYNGLTGDLAPLAQLLSLQKLEIFECHALAGDLTPLAHLHNLQSLEISSCDAIAGDLAPLGQLRNLQSLEISFCDALAGTLTPLAQLRNLHSLSIDSCTALAGNLAPIAQLLNLQSLSISACHALAGDLAPLAQLRNLKSLSIDSCKALVGDLAPLAQLRKLHSLSIEFCNALAGNLAPLAQLRNLKSLSISSCQNLAGDLAPLAQLRNLQSLSISSCPALAGDLAPLAQLRNLQSLNILGSHSLAGDLTSLLKLKKLRRLTTCYTSSLRISRSLSRQLVRKNSPLKELFCDVIEGIPPEILSRDWHSDNCLPRLRSYLADLDAGEAEEADVKLILLGNGRVGKTQLCRRLRGEEFELDSVSTHGVQLYRQPLQLRKNGVELTYFANWWDFGGQDIYHSTHSLFLRSRAVFLILWTPHLENCDEFQENGIPLRNQPLAYWLDYVRSLAGSDSPVIVVQGQCENFAAKLDPPTRATGFQFAEYCSFGAANNHGRETLEALLHDAIRYLGEKNGRLLIGTGRARLRERLYTMRNTERTLDFAAFEALCQEVGDIASPEHALDYFHQTGVLFHRKGLFGDRIMLDQSWALDAVYTVFHRASTMPALRERGTFTRQDLESLCWTNTPREEQHVFLGLMESCGICFVHHPAEDGEHTYLAPDLLPPYEKVEKQLFAWNPGAEKAVLRLEYRFLHQALLRSLISRIGTDARDHAIYWKYGLWLRTAGGTQLLIRQETLPTGDAPGAGCLRIAAQGPEWARLLDEVRWVVRDSPVLEKPEESLMLGGVTVARRDLDHWVDGKVRTADGRTTDPRPFAEFWNEERLRRREDFAMPSTPTFAAAPLPPPAPAKHEVYISYAWGDTTKKGKVRTEVVDRLCDALRGDGFVVRRDRDDIAPGDLISKFMRELVNANFVVAIISDKYLRSPNCMFELYKLYQAGQGEIETLAAKVVPVVLPGTKLTTLTERAEYIRHWKRELTTAEELAKELGLEFGGAAYKEARLIKEFAHFAGDLIAFIGDVLMERKLAVHYSNDFEGVRQALKRKIAALA